MTEIVFETHSATVDNEHGVATGWLPGALSGTGRRQARELGERRAKDRFDAIFSSDLARAADTVTHAFASRRVPVVLDWRLRECNYGDLNGSPVSVLHRERHIDLAYPSGESWRQAVSRVGLFVCELQDRWPAGRVLVIGHTATRWGLEHLLNKVSLEELVAESFDWQPGWEYVLHL